ncbi:MAG: hypothetical protein NVSMB23_17900 [Myxococcales bacterium]
MSPLSHEEVQENAGGLAALPPGDAERLAAYAHARTCESCRRALSQGEALQRVLGAVALPAPAPAALRRASAEILAELRAHAPGRSGRLPSRASRWAPVAPALAAAASWALLLAATRHPFHPGAAGESAVFALAGAACAALALTALRSWALPAALLASAALVLANAGPGPGLMALGAQCLAAEVASGALPLALTAFLALRGKVSGGALLYAGVAAGGALAGQAALQLTCPASTASAHLAAFHFAGVVAAALIGAGVSRAPPLRHAIA